MEWEAERRECGGFLVVLAVAVAAGGGLVEPNILVAHRLELGRHLAGVAGMHPVVAAGGGDQDRRIRPSRPRPGVGRIRFLSRPFLGLVGGGGFGWPAAAG